MEEGKLMKKNFILITVILLSFAVCSRSKVYYMKSDNASVYRGTAGVGGGVKRRLGEEVGKTFKDMPALFDMEAEIDGKKYRRYAEESNNGICKWVASDELSETPEKTGIYDGMYFAVKPDEKIRHSNFMLESKINFLLYSKEEAILLINYDPEKFFMKGKYETSSNSLTIKINEVHERHKTSSGFFILPARRFIAKVNTIQARCEIKERRIFSCKFYDYLNGQYRKGLEYILSQNEMEAYIKMMDEIDLENNETFGYKIHQSNDMFMYSKNYL